MQLNSTEISELIKQRIAQFNVVSEAHNEGTIVSVSDGIIRVHGLADVMQGEMIALPGNRYAIALNLERDSVGAVVMGPYADLAEGMKVKCTGRILEVPVGRGLLGRVVNTLGAPIDGKGAIDNDGFSPVEVIAPGVIDRQSVDQPVQTGYKSVDAMIPIGRGQRELIIGDRQTGKTAMAIDAIINQPGISIREVNDEVVRIMITGLVELGILDGDVDTLIAEEAHRPFYMHGLGHWLGLDVHDVGHYGTPSRDRILEPGMVLTVEPGLYIAPDADVPVAYRGIGIRIEDDIVITEEGIENLTDSVVKEADEIEALMAAAKQA